MKITKEQEVLDMIKACGAEGIISQWLLPSQRTIAYRLVKKGKIAKFKIDCKGYPTAFISLDYQ